MYKIVDQYTVATIYNDHYLVNIIRPGHFISTVEATFGQRETDNKTN